MKSYAKVNRSSNNQDLMNTIYDMLAQNDVEMSMKDEVTRLIDRVDLDRNAIVFKYDNGREFELQLVNTYAPAPEAKL